MTPSPLTVQQFVAGCVARLAPVYTPSEARWIMRVVTEHLKGWSRTDYVVNAAAVADPAFTGRVERILGRLLGHEPVQYILGETYWHGMRIGVNPSVLIPRGETSELVDIITDDAGGRPDLRVMDVCTGSGCIALALARALPYARVTATDLSAPALDTARANASALDTTVTFIQADALAPASEPQAGHYDIVVSNPPYIGQSEAAAMSRNVLDYEPHMALFVPDGHELLFYRAIAANARIWLAAGGRLYFELNPLHARALADSLTACGWADVEVMKDIHGKDRFLRARL